MTSTGRSAPDLGSMVVPEYGSGSLAEVVPSLLSAAGISGFANSLRVDPVRGVCLLVIDGLGWQQLEQFRADAPFMASAMEHSRHLTAGFPSTTATSLASLGTGLPPGQHGLVGLTVRIEGRSRPMSLLRWEVYGGGPAGDLRDEVSPEAFQPSPTVLERAADEGARVTLVGPPGNVGSGLSRAILRGGDYVAATTLDELVEAAAEVTTTSPATPVFAYHPFLDTIGHIRGVGTDEWAGYLRLVDGAVQALRHRLPKEVALAVTSDHGMVNVEEDSRLDLGDEADLTDGVTLVAGEPRARHVHVEEGAVEDVRARWMRRLGDLAWIFSGDEAIARGLFGPSVSDFVRPRIGDLVVSARGTGGVFQRRVDPVLAGLIGQHGSLTPAEQLVPFLLFAA